MVHRKKKLYKIIKKPIATTNRNDESKNSSYFSLQQWSTHDVPRLIPGLCVVWHVFIFHSVQISWDQNKSIATCIGILYFEMNDLLFLIFLRLFLRLTAAYTCQPGIIGFYTGGTIFCICRIYNYIFSTCLTIWSTVAHVSWWHHTHSPDQTNAGPINYKWKMMMKMREKKWSKCNMRKLLSSINQREQKKCDLYTRAFTDITHIDSQSGTQKLFQNGTELKCLRKMRLTT